MNATPQRPLDRLLLGCLRLLPARLARHLLFLLKSYPALADQWGYHVRPIHFYEPLPDFARLPLDAFGRRREFPALDFNWPAQLELIRRLGAAHGADIQALGAAGGADGFPFDNDFFAGFDAALYYALVRDLQPARIIEIGCGFSTRIADKALQRNAVEGHPGKLTCIEPFPEARLTDAKLDIELIQQPVEAVDLALFEALGSGDILFIDSSHALKFGGDVCREFLDILPRLKSGVHVHVHDIFFPLDYPEEWVAGKRIAFNEQYLLEAFLAHNSAFSIVAANHWLALDHAELMAGLWPATREFHGKTSFWMRKR